ncbi:DUF2780 domain-containing protein [Paraglaciecola aquimarina]|uniref:DUF2780 domain-containing protein n=1 Tax=Paraglaciecola algarum TaxID=3050085 RepID=A0ABS9DAQ3_9ALTE|nr:DUF2780 domain-containing protein [Paraglaciecola sp. G1-23]MCF2950009.1 DUF2780 domain-containing protein [Paraglaciecola sp. G1-23]
MKISHLILLLTTLTFSNISIANDIVNSAKDMFGKSNSKTNSLNVTDMVGSVADSLGMTKSQATGSLGSIFEYAKNNISKEQVSALTKSLPGLDSLLSAVPAISGTDGDNKNNLGGLLGKAAQYSDSLNSVANLQKQFESHGLDADMINKVIQSVYNYLNTEQGQQVKSLLEKGLSSLKL